ncbi:hypothetical protein [Paraburkholderia humisilvae]|uniref:Uncharacterized protein n=2 Tax=Paraburkholderia humisilvae TaxID=627669 RepID=A0A6J5F9X0_9BURK|nr:hypothetical protein [Paraburkholderia humisilvae]CAB3774237.1 hypothetical protein LMG29542_07659 [Paraburkholderia humisilvae]
MPPFRQRYISELLPLEQTSTVRRIRIVHCLDRAYDQLIEAERWTAAIVAVDLAGDLIGGHEAEGEALKAIYDRYSDAKLPQRSTE